jgi:hypothetical protein
MYKKILFLCATAVVVGVGIFFLLVEKTKDPSEVLMESETIVLQEETSTTTVLVSTEPEVEVSDVVEEDIEQIPVPQPIKFDRINQQLLVAHAMGAIATTTVDGTGTNSLEAFLFSYEQGFRIFETDIVITRDDQAFLLHDNTEPLVGLAPGETYRSVSSSAILGKKFRDTFTILTWHDALVLLQTYQDVSFVLDIKDEFAKTLEILSADPLFYEGNIRQRIIPQVYNPDDMMVVREYGFEDIILTLYRSEMTDDEVLFFVGENPDITVVTMWWNQRYSDRLAVALRERGVGTYVHTPNKRTDVRSFLIKGVGVYTDVFYK